MMDQSTHSSSLASHEHAEPAGMAVHMALFLAMALVASAVATLVFRIFSIAPAAAGAVGLLVLSVSLALHFAISSRVEAPLPKTAARPVKLRGMRRQSPPEDAFADALLTAGRQADERIAEPTELALDLLRRASEQALPALLREQTPPVLASLSQRSPSPEPTEPKLLPDAGFAADPMPGPIPDLPVQETELQRVERLVKRLADEVNAKDHAVAPLPPPLPARAIASQPMVSPAPAMAPLAPPMIAEVAAPPLDPAATQLTLELTSAIASLPKWPEPAGAPRVDEVALDRREAILSALHAQRIDVFVEPILGLNDQRPQHYEVSIGLKGANGETLNLAEAASSLSGTGLLPLIDSARIAKAAQMARRLADRGKTGAVLTEFSTESLNDRETQADLTGRSNVGVFPGQLVLMLPQAQVRLFSAADWQTLARLSAAGFGFALTDVTSLDMDFAALVQGGFTFARLDAATFLVGLPVSDGLVEPGGICRHLALSGLSLIVGGIVDDVQLAKIFGFGVLFGQGQLFGGPRPLGAPSLRPDTPVASAAE